MRFDKIQPGNTLRTNATSLEALTKFWKGKNVEEGYIRKCIGADKNGRALYRSETILEYVLHRMRERKALHTVMQYHGQAKI